MKKSYNCVKCPAYCCSYPRIIVTDKDIRRLAEHFEVGSDEARKRYTKKGHEKGERVLKRQDDEHFGRICGFLDLETRRCTIYEGRPQVCRDFPGKGRCGYYDFLKFERNAQEDKAWVATTWSPED